MLVNDTKWVCIIDYLDYRLQQQQQRPNRIALEEESFLWCKVQTKKPKRWWVGWVGSKHLSFCHLLPLHPGSAPSNRWGKVGSKNGRLANTTSSLQLDSLLR